MVDMYHGTEGRSVCCLGMPAWECLSAWVSVDVLVWQQVMAQVLGVLATHKGDLDGITGSWHQPGLPPAVAGIWGINEWMKDLSLSLCHFAFKVNK